MPMPNRDEAIQALFDPLDVRAFSSGIDAAHVGELHRDESVAIGSMAAGRQAEFATARACARAALSDLGVQSAVPRQPGGAPQWPVGMAGSISHTRGFCVAVASADRTSIGIDVEEIARMKPNVERRILIDQEQDLVQELAAGDRQRSVATIFAAKEAFYKAHYEIEPRYLGFDAVWVTVNNDVVNFSPASGEVDPSVLEATTGRVRIDQGRVIVGVAINPTNVTSPLRSRA